MTTRADADTFSRTLENICIGQGYKTMRGGMMGAFFVLLDDGSRYKFLVEVTQGD